VAAEVEAEAANAVVEAAVVEQVLASAANFFEGEILP
jgi:hypothetical protein